MPIEGYNPPSATRVAGRSLVLVSLAFRAFVEDNPDEGMKAAAADLLPWLTRIGLIDELEEGEYAFLNAPIGAHDERSIVNYSWRVEGAAVLAWALGKLELLPFDKQVSPGDVADQIGFFEDAPVVLDEPTLVRSELIETYADYIEAIHWRLRRFMLEPGPFDFRNMAVNASFPGLPSRLIQNDLAVGGKVIVDADPSLVGQANSIVMERHAAANWLLGQEALYSEVTADT